jgi:hypothetical protein
MDPYLEQRWRSVHHRLITYAADQLRPCLPRELRPNIEERVFIETYEGEHRDIYPDVYVVEHPQKPERGLSPAPSVRSAVAEPILVHIAREPASQGYIEIIDAESGNRVVTVIEFVSPTNKLPGEGQGLYRKKQSQVISAGASLVEIDLNRTGKRSMFGPIESLQPRMRATYMACVTRGWNSDTAEFYPLDLREPLAAIRIPLRQSDADVALDLQALIDQVYENGGYETIDYSHTPLPPLDPENAAWAEQWLRARGALG